MPLNSTDLDKKTCNHCGLSLREHCTEQGGAWFVRPCDGMLRAFSPPVWDAFAGALGSCQLCGQTMRSHYQVGLSGVCVKLRETIEEINLPDAKPGQVVILPIQGFVDCRASR